MRITAPPWRDQLPPASVYADGTPLDLAGSLRVFSHSPDGFAWGYQGSGPAQLALAILLRAADRRSAMDLHQRFKREIVARWPQDDPLDVEVDVAGWLAKCGTVVDQHGRL